MKSGRPANHSSPEDKTLLLLLVAVSLAFALILWPFYGVVVWAVVLATIFAPLYRRLLNPMRQRRTLAALATVMIILVMVILPLTLMGAALAQEASGVYKRVASGELNPGRDFQRVFEALPRWAATLLNRLGLSDFGAVQERLSAGLAKGSQFLFNQAVNLGENTFSFLLRLFIMLYLLFFLLRDGDHLAQRLKNAIRLRPEQRQALLNKFTAVIRATVKGNLLIAIIQGALGGLIFWILGLHAPLLAGVVMAVVSLLPVAGAALVWVPVGLYLLLSGAVWRGVVLLAYGILVMSVVGTFLQPLLVGKGAKMPNYVVLISTLGGLAVFGANGLVLGPVIAAMFIAAWDIFSAPE